MRQKTGLVLIHCKAKSCLLASDEYIDEDFLVLISYTCQSIESLRKFDQKQTCFISISSSSIKDLRIIETNVRKAKLGLGYYPEVH